MNFIPKLSRPFKKSYSWGDNNAALGRKNLEEEKHYGKPTEVPKLEKIRLIAVGGSHTIAFTESNKMFSCGKNEFGQLGKDDKVSNEEFVEVKNDIFTKDDPVISLACGDQHSVCVTESGIVYVWGKGFCGQLGLGNDKSNKYVPTVHEILSVRNIRRVSAGMRHTIFLNKFGEIYSTGFGKYGQLGLGDNLDRYYPCLIEDFNAITVKSKNCFNIALTEKYEVFIWGGRRFEERKISERQYSNNVPRRLCHNLLGRRVIDIACSTDHGLILTSVGDVFTFGYHLHNTGYTAHLKQILDKIDDDKITLSETAKKLSKEKLDISEKSIIKSERGLLIFKNHFIKQEDKIIKIECGEAGNFAISESGKVYSWGLNVKLELGQENEKNIQRPKIIKSLEKEFISDVSCGVWTTYALVGDKNTQKSTHLVLEGQKVPKKLQNLNANQE